MVKLGTAMPRIFVISPETARCPLCGPNPDFMVIDGQALGSTDPDDAFPTRVEEECPVLDIPAAKLCVIESTAMRVAIIKVVRSAAALTDTQELHIRNWHRQMLEDARPNVETSAAYLFLHFLPLGRQASNMRKPGEAPSGGATGPAPPQASLAPALPTQASTSSAPAPVRGPGRAL